MRAPIAFVALAYGLAWSLWLPLAWQGITVGPGDGWPSHLPGLLAPALAAMIVTAASQGRTGLAALISTLWRRPRGPAARWVAALLLLTLLCALLPAITDPETPPGAFLTYSGAPLLGLWVVPYVFVLNGLGEELGWRGFLVDSLLERFGPIGTAVIVWLVWAAWHAPLFLIVESFRVLGWGGAIGWMIGIGCGSLVLTWLYVAANRSVLVTALWHTAYNFATATLAATMLSTGLASVLVIAVCVGLLRHPGFWTTPTSNDKPASGLASNGKALL